ncbi:hypothetical protein BJI67_15725 (plasmid) [Acidihalobacter aeolianus]|uniref:Uncharacterized protein n=1 Tax=Acidihalobacter aeolianus TaxID=2792603 RepID=A0A1D8KCN0_9GAMM|nr:hypothetical protein [Acidihalobacter aeolianus]AOV18695.1 hypothetical protein BJI67_15725 [Acidihalobacter aeolianus]
MSTIRKSELFLDIQNPDGSQMSVREVNAHAHRLMRVVRASTAFGDFMLSDIHYRIEAIGQQYKLTYTERRSSFLLRFFFAPGLILSGRRPFGFFTPDTRSLMKQIGGQP